MGRGEGSGDKAAYWQAVLGAQTSSGLSVRRFCAERGLALSQFYYWRRPLGAVGTERPLGEAGSEAGGVPSFVELDLGKSVAAREYLPLEIHLDLGGGCSLSIRRG
jgi:putative transposase